MGSGSCTPIDAVRCNSNSGEIGSDSCKDGSSTGQCDSNNHNPVPASLPVGFGIIGSNSCNNGGRSQCAANGLYQSSGEIGNGSCNGGGTLHCQDNGGGLSGTGIIGDGSCNIVIGNTGASCANNRGSIGNGSCNAAGSCTSNTGIIAEGCCNYENACNNNAAVIDSDHVECFASASSSLSKSASPWINPSNVLSLTIIQSLLFYLLVLE
eukprot:CAMPEP_0195538340 /NCGR_PEP_ID=MMETSP0794_2-20130614/49476_1 /TAXON_ID=515487 /ORGANISM="Stephanopyxis turris, Strain CCMP 815" /LENGTH=209 /DNA_ID=CAMNT_0040672311 /DNA_START=123 /DNA_END=752 /DNA_ORIENTATION=+